MTQPTTPPSSPLDTLKHTVHRVVDLIDTAQDLIGTNTGSSDAVEDGLEVLDAAIRYLYCGLAEHVDGVNPDGLSIERYASDAAFAAARTYDDGSPVVVARQAGKYVLFEFPRLGGNAGLFDVEHLRAALSLVPPPAA